MYFQGVLFIFFFTIPSSTMLNARKGIASELHKQSRVNFPRRHVEVKGISDLYQADLVEMLPFSRTNRGYKYILTIINCFTKFAIAIPLKSKSADSIEKALSKVLKKYPMKHFQTDQGSEFFNLKVKTLLNKFNINHYFTYSEKKACIIERFNRTLKNRMWRLFSEQGSYKWLHILPKLVYEYNNKVHRTIGQKPVDVDESNEKEIFLRIISQRRKYVDKPKFSVGDHVRISRLSKTFGKGYTPRWSNEIYTVHSVQNTSPVTYILKDCRGEILRGGFYEQEVSKTKYKESYLIEKVIKSRGDKLLVRWLGFDKSHDSWIDRKDLIQ